MSDICPIHETVLIDGQCKPCGGALERNRRIGARWDELSAQGKHGHYETLFQVVREEIELLEEANEELIRGMTEMAERFTAAMNLVASPPPDRAAIVGQCVEAAIETAKIFEKAAADMRGNTDPAKAPGRPEDLFYIGQGARHAAAAIRALAQAPSGKGEG